MPSGKRLFAATGELHEDQGSPLLGLVTEGTPGAALFACLDL